MQMWEKLGHVYSATGTPGWATSRAYLPSSLSLSDRIRVFVAFLDDDLVGRLGYVDVDLDDPTRVLGVSQTPALDVGRPGAFDDCGVNPLSVFRHQSRVWLYYAGWQRTEKLPYLLFTGLAHSDDEGKTFRRWASVPVLDRTDAEPTLRSGTFVIPPGEGLFRAWYVTGSTWIEAGGKARPTYGMRYIESADGVNWPTQGVPCLEPVGPDEYGFGRPYVLDDGDRLRMWYSIRTISRGYRLGYAESRDGVSWKRLDERIGIDVSEGGWDSEMIHCAYIEQVAGQMYLFYNGNEYGATGFGVAAYHGVDGGP